MKSIINAEYAIVESWLIGNKPGVNAPSDRALSQGLQNMFVTKVEEKRNILVSSARKMPSLASKYNNLTSKQFQNRFIEDLKDFWTAKILPTIMEELVKLKKYSGRTQEDIQETMSFVYGMMAPLTILSEYEGESATIDATEDAGGEVPEPDEGSNTPGAVRRGASYLGSLAKTAALGAVGGAAASALGSTKMLGTLAKIGAGAIGLHKAALRSVGGKSGPGIFSRIGGSIRNMFGRSSSAVSTQTHDFTPREEELEGGHGVIGVLNRIEANTRALLDRLGGNGAVGKKGGLGGLLGNLIGMAPMLLKLGLIAGGVWALVKIVNAIGAKLNIDKGITEGINQLLDKMGKKGIEISDKLQPYLGQEETIQERRERVEAGGSRRSIDRADKQIIIDKLATADFDGKKLSSNQIAGIMGNLEAESDFNPRAVNPNGGASGIAQWLDTRKDALYKFAEERGKPWHDLETQVDFLIHELKTTHKKPLHNLLKAGSTKEAADVVTSQFEVPYIKGKTDPKVIEKEHKKRQYKAEAWEKSVATHVENDISVAPPGDNMTRAERESIRYFVSKGFNIKDPEGNYYPNFLRYLENKRNELGEEPKYDILTPEQEKDYTSYTGTTKDAYENGLKTMLKNGATPSKAFIEAAEKNGVDVKSIMKQSPAPKTPSPKAPNLTPKDKKSDAGGASSVNVAVNNAKDSPVVIGSSAPAYNNEWSLLTHTRSSLASTLVPFTSTV